MQESSLRTSTAGRNCTGPTCSNGKRERASFCYIEQRTSSIISFLSAPFRMWKRLSLCAPPSRRTSAVKGIVRRASPAHLLLSLWNFPAFCDLNPRSHATEDGSHAKGRFRTGDRRNIRVGRNCGRDRGSDCHG